MYNVSTEYHYNMYFLMIQFFHFIIQNLYINTLQYLYIQNVKILTSFYVNTS